jgi:glycosyltransferase involved in cell wall biosynthesis
MKIAFYAPLKPPDHPTPSGDRQMANLLMAALRRAGHETCIVSRLRTYMASPHPELLQSIQLRAEGETARIADQWQETGSPHIWFTYHPYYKAPDLIGAELSQRFSIPYVTCEASYARKRDNGEWRDSQALFKKSLGQAALNIHFTDRDREGLAQIVSPERLAELKPFTDAQTRRRAPAMPSAGPAELITVAMMRDGDKFDSYRMLAASLSLLPDTSWRLTVIGDGPAAGKVRELFRQFADERIKWMGMLPAEAVSAELSKANIYVWPGFGEAYGMAYLEAQGAGLPVIAQNVAGVPAVVRNGETGILVSQGDVRGFANAIRRCIADPNETRRLGDRAREFIRSERSLDRAADRLNILLSRLSATMSER